MFKFPGGGLEDGEGTIDALKREFMEELQLEIEVLEHHYTTDFHTRSTFDPDLQVVSIYYKVRPLRDSDLEQIEIDKLGTEPAQKKESFQWHPTEGLFVDHFTFATERAAWRKWLSESVSD